MRLKTLQRRAGGLRAPAMSPACQFPPVGLPSIEEFTPERARESPGPKRDAPGRARHEQPPAHRQAVGPARPPRLRSPIVDAPRHARADGFGQVNVIEPEASANRRDRVRPDPARAAARSRAAIAEALYVALMTDTGSFRYSNTGHAHAHRHGRRAADLRHRSAEHPRAGQRARARPDALRVLRVKVLSALESARGRLASSCSRRPRAVRSATGLCGADTEGLVDLPRSIAGVDVVSRCSPRVVSRGRSR